MIKRPAFFLDIQACTGCKTCMVACKDKNDLGAGLRWRRVYEFAGGEWFAKSNGTFTQNVFAYYVSMSCNHCENPICVRSCPTTAMSQDENGIIVVDTDLCMGCCYCQWVCPYSAPQFDTSIGKMTKCDFCRDEITKGGQPACVAACPTRAIDFGDYDKLAAVHSTDVAIAPLPPLEITSPNLLIRPPKQAKPTESTHGLILNPEEVKDE